MPRLRAGLAWLRGFFSAADRLFVPLSFLWGLARRHAHFGGAHNPRIAARMAHTIGPVTSSGSAAKLLTMTPTRGDNSPGYHSILAMTRRGSSKDTT